MPNDLDTVPIVLCVILFSIFLWYEIRSHIAEFRENKESPNAAETTE